MKINHCRGTSRPIIPYQQANNDYKQSRGYLNEWERSVFTFTLKQNGPCIVVAYAEIPGLKLQLLRDLVRLL